MQKVPLELDIKELVKLKSKNDINWDKIFETVFKEVIGIIKLNAKKGISEFIYPVPLFQLGIPRYPIGDCVEYHVNKLKSLGFRSKIQRDNFIAISWRHHEADYKPEPVQIHIQQQEIPKLKENKSISSDWTAYKMGHPDFIPLMMNNPMKIFRTNNHIPKNDGKWPNIQEPRPISTTIAPTQNDNLRLLHEIQERNKMDDFYKKQLKQQKNNPIGRPKKTKKK